MGMGYSDRLFDSQVEIDLEATKEWYSRGKEWGCECAHCRNFLELARNKQFPQQITDLLDSFGSRCLFPHHRRCPQTECRTSGSSFLFW